MKHTALCTAACALLVGCDYHDDDDHHHSDPVPTFAEIEPNDFANEVDHFGVIVPGDHFAILGNVRNDSGDPADGFGFTAAEPIHVEFRLFAENPFADIAVGLYDPQIDETVATFQTGANPELGSVDVFAGNVDFHLVVVTNLEPTDYDLELQVYAFQPAARAASESAGPSLAARGGAVATASEVDGPGDGIGSRLQGYAGTDEGSASLAPDSVLGRFEVLELTPGTEGPPRSSFILTADGTWMGIPGGLPE